MSIFISCFLFAFGVFLVIKGGDWFVDAASWIARAANIPSFIIGATIVSFATTLPEMIVSAVASIEGKNDMAVGNAIGSVTANTGLIMAIAFIFMTVITPRRNYMKQSFLLLCAAGVLWIGSFRGQLAAWACFLLVVIFAAFMLFNVKEAQNQQNSSERPEICTKEIAKNIFLFILGAAGIVLGSNCLISGGSSIAIVLGVPERVIAVTMVAIGTSLPELVTTITAIKKNEANLSVGNIIGANIIDLSLILPVCTVVSGGTFSVARQSLWIDFPVSILLSVIAVVPMMAKERAYKKQGIVMLLIYAIYLLVTF